MTPFTDKDVRHMHWLYTSELWPMEAVGAKYEISRETVRNLFMEHKLAIRPRGTSVTAQRNLKRAQERHTAIVEAYKLLGNIPEVAVQFELPEVYVSNIVSTIRGRERYRRRAHTQIYSDDDLLEALRRAADALGEPLAVVPYQKAAKVLGLPAHMTIIGRFGTWQEACRLAGVECNPGLDRPRRGITKTDCYRSMRECRTELGKRPTYTYYTRWARENGKPSGPTVRVKCGDWKTASKGAFG